MARNIKIWTRIEIPGHAPMGVHPNAVPVVITTSSDEIHDQVHSVTTTSIIKLFDVADDLGDAELIAVVSDKAGLLQVVTNTAADWFTLQLVANVPIVIAGDTTEQSDGGVGLFDGTADTIERIYAKNTSAVTAKIRVLVVT